MANGDGTVFPAFLKLEHAPNPAAANSFVAEVERATDGGLRKFQQFSTEAQRLLDQAMTTRRNQFGSLDLGAEQIKAAAQAQQARALAAREVAQAVALAAKEEGDYGRQARLSVAATEALAREEEEAAAVALRHAAAIEQVQERLNRQKSATDLVTQATGRGTTAQQNVINSTRASRVAFVQLGQQMQDVVIQAQLGTTAFQIFAQQVPQAAFALTGLADSANRTQARIGAIATFLSGPWGAAIFAATAVLGPFIYSMFQTGDAAAEAEKKVYDFSEGLDVLTLTAQQTTNAMRQLAQETRNAIEVQGDFLQASAVTAGQSVRAIESRLNSASTELARLRRDAGGLSSLIPFNVPDYPRINELQQQIAADREALALARQAQTSASLAVSQQRAIESRDPIAAARGEYERAVGDLNRRFRQSQSDPIGAQNAGLFISQAEYEAEFGRLTSLRDAAEDAARKKPTRERDQTASMQRLAEFGEDAGKKIANIGDRFADIPSEVLKVNQATRELDDIISDLERRKPEGFQDLIEQAQELKDLIPDLGLDRAMADLREQTDLELQAQRLILAGREDEAETLRLMVQLKDQFGPDAEREAEAVRDIVEGRNDELEVLRRLQEEQSAYLDVTRGVRGELEAMFSGRGRLSNFNQLFRDLQARTTVEALFGDALRDLDDWVKGSPLKDSVDHLAEETDRAGNAALDFADTLITARDRITSSVTSTATGFEQAFGPEFWATLNPNGPSPEGEAITVTGRALERGIAGMSPEAYFEQMAQKIVGPLTDELNEIFGTTFFGNLQGALSGALYGLATGGSVGGLLGGGKGLIDSLGILGGSGGALSGLLGKALGGAQTGQLVNGFGNLLGLGLSGTGSQLGGALGSIFGPVGSILGSVGGGIIGKIFGGLFGSTKYGTATVSGGSVSTRGKGKGRAEGAGTLGGAVQDALDNIADQLDAEIGSYLVSIGTYKDSFRVSGSGKSGKLKGGDVKSFADQGEAIAFAVMDAIRDGAIKGLSAGAQRLLQGNSDIEAAVQDAIDFESVFKRLKAAKDPTGAALDDLDREFERLKDLFTRAGASVGEWAQLEELYWLERDEIIKEAMEGSLSSLRDFLTELTVGNEALSLRDRRSAAVAAFDPLAARVAAGDTTAYDGFVEAARALLDIERELFGSQSGYFERLNQVTGLTQRALDGGAGGSFADRDSPFGARGAANDNAAVAASIDQLRDDLVNTSLAAVNQNLGTLIALQQQQLAAMGHYDARGKYTSYY